jgi:hypothetical protein
MQALLDAHETATSGPTRLESLSIDHRAPFQRSTKGTVTFRI